MKKPILAPVLIVFLLLTSLRALAGLQRSDPKQSLRDLSGVYVISQFIDVQPQGLTTDGINKMVKAALANARITADAEPKKDNGDANLSITLDTISRPRIAVPVHDLSPGNVKKNAAPLPGSLFAQTSPSWF